MRARRLVVRETAVGGNHGNVSHRSPEMNRTEVSAFFSRLRAALDLQKRSQMLNIGRLKLTDCTLVNWSKCAHRLERGRWCDCYSCPSLLRLQIRTEITEMSAAIKDEHDTYSLPATNSYDQKVKPQRHFAGKTAHQWWASPVCGSFNVSVVYVMGEKIWRRKVSSFYTVCFPSNFSAYWLDISTYEYNG